MYQSSQRKGTCTGQGKQGDEGLGEWKRTREEIRKWMDGGKQSGGLKKTRDEIK
jgi:hypothetical protein